VREPLGLYPERGRVAVNEEKLREGALVVYGGHGLGRIRANPPGDAHPAASIVVEFAGGLSVTFPRERALDCLRSVAGADEVALVQDALRYEGGTIEKSWQARTRTTRTKIAAGDALALAEVVRDAVTRQRRSPSVALSIYEHELYMKARRLLAAELSAATATDETQADAWIDGQLGAPFAEAG